MNQYRCETCKTCCPYNFNKSDDEREFDFDERIRYGNIRLHTKKKGCASHSDIQIYQCGDNCKGECSGEVSGTSGCPYQSDRDKVLDELQVIKQYDRIRFHQKHTLPKSWVEVKVTSVSKDGKRIGISGKMPGEGCTTEMCINLSDVRQVCRWIELRQQAGES
jgi:hypothetical protein